MCTDVCSDSENGLGQEQNLQHNENFEYENYSACGRKLSTNFSLIYYFSCSFAVSFAVIFVVG